ncbi:TetR family transcriptional regulator [Nocardia otitidiscaviarum]|uniref:TetR/AcrR family transcriptional regulator n=1 Tax=Nocardia otitidiscaviarum TaxID=1823 RepID=UPI0004A6F2B7|nr:TetR/AcrR family transcriptional regulator [Nocardia otitidiscaviarum]MBF6136948.1 TetR family transcriptional regulator [Nocardia otitidiscaviarum]MBF6485151.1 TetR family transcriptional regulator [Nocardia otitidiscaviarum]
MTFTERGRRAQILDAALETIVDLGWANTSFMRIAERIGVTKGAVLHYFPDKNALVGALVLDVHGRLAAAVDTALAAQDSAIGRIRAFILANTEFIAEHPRDIAAIIELSAAYRGPDGRRLAEIITAAEPLPRELRTLDLAALLARDRQQLRVRDVDFGILTLIIRGAIDAAAERRAHDPEFDPRPVGHELAEMVEIRLGSAATTSRADG